MENCTFPRDLRDLLRLQKGKGDWDSWLTRVGLRLRLGRVKKNSLQNPIPVVLPTPRNLLPQQLCLLSSPHLFSAVASTLSKQRLLGQRLSSNLQKVVTVSSQLGATGSQIERKFVTRVNLPPATGLYHLGMRASGVQSESAAGRRGGMETKEGKQLQLPLQ